MIEGDYAIEVANEKRAREIVEKRKQHEKDVLHYHSALEAQHIASEERKHYVDGRLKADVHFAVHKIRSHQNHFDRLRVAKVSCYQTKFYQTLTPFGFSWRRKRPTSICS